MKNRFILSLLILANSLLANAVEVIRINQLGYLPKSIKVAVFLSSEENESKHFTVHHTLSDKEVFKGQAKVANAENWGMKTAYRLDFSDLEITGGYYIKLEKTKSPSFRINADVYEGTADFILNYLRQQRCGYNPFLKDSCHTHDGIIVDHPTKSGETINVTGGWHDASDYLQYSTTSVNTVFQMLFAYRNFPEVYTDHYKLNGQKGKNNIPDILDEIKWGINWMLKMNPAPNEMYNQIADDRDHVGYRLPNKDSANYDLGKYRPVYFVTGKPQGLSKYKNQSTGVSSIAGKFASGFALGAQLFEKSDPKFSEELKIKAIEAWQFALSDTGFCQTACNVSPYFYEERNFADDLELAATQLFELTKDAKFISEAKYWGEKEHVSPWIKDGDARHYESYPFINLGHYFLSKNGINIFDEYFSEGLNYLFERGKDDPFLNGLPFIWCSNNLVVAAITQARLYSETFGEKKYKEMEAALRDWLLGCNPWGTAMICGLPGVADSPMFPHSSFTVLLNETTYGGLVDGPVYNTIFNNLIGIELTKEDKYAPFNKGKAVYHDDIGDYSTNEPTMDGTASLSYYLASLEMDGRKQKENLRTYQKDNLGCIIRINPEKKNIYLVFTADSFFEGGEHVLRVLNKNNIKGSFFLTGNFLRLSAQKEIIKDIVEDGHFIGVHSDNHLLYCDWERRDSTLLTFDEFETDLKTNFDELEKFGIQAKDTEYFMPPYEWYNQKIVDWSRSLGLNLINFTPGTGTNADYTWPKLKNYKSSEQIFSELKKFEINNKDGLNGAILLIHPGTNPSRSDKFYFKLNDLIEFCLSKGYIFKTLQK